MKTAIDCLRSVYSPKRFFNHSQFKVKIISGKKCANPRREKESALLLDVKARKQNTEPEGRQTLDGRREAIPDHG